MPDNTEISRKNAIDVIDATMQLSTYKGWFDYQDPELVDIDDITRSVSRQPRYLGHTVSPYTVAQHSVAMAKLAKVKGLSEDTQLAALMHDAAEAYCGDLPHPLKKVLPKYQEIVEQVEEIIAKKYDYAYPHTDAVAELDREMYLFERRGVAATLSVQAENVDPPPEPVMEQLTDTWDHKKARRNFRFVFDRLYE